MGVLLLLVPIGCGLAHFQPSVQIQYSGVVAVACSALMVFVDPRRNRPLGLLVVLVCLFAPISSTAGMVVTTTLGLLSLGFVEAARRSVNGPWLRGGPPIG